jgi:V8-like Glu-specific endopeptidase
VRPRSILQLGLVLTVFTPACSGIKPFRIQNEPAPTPAALPEDGREELPANRLGLAQEDDYVVRVVAGPVTCSGTLIEDDRVLTAHHCVSERDRDGNFLSRDVSASEIRVELGGDYLPWGEVGVRAVIAPPCGYAAGEGDIAILVLERNLVGVATVKPRLEKTVELGEGVNPVGFGRCLLSGDGIRRQNRKGGKVDRVLESRFRLDAAICPGDSGGPVLSRRTGEVVGVISASVMDGSEATTGRSEFTRLDKWRPIFSTAKLIAEGTSQSEVPPVDGCPSR